MSDQSKLLVYLMKPVYQAIIVFLLTMVLTAFDALTPSDDAFYKVNTGPWIVSTAMILLFITLNTVLALRVDKILPYWIQSLICFVVLGTFAYGWSYMLSGSHIDDVGSFRWIWMVLGMVYLVFFIIVRSIKNIVDFAIRQDNKLRGEED
jgi:hypothetical protein